MDARASLARFPRYAGHYGVTNLRRRRFKILALPTVRSYELLSCLKILLFSDTFDNSVRT